VWRTLCELRPALRAAFYDFTAVVSFARQCRVSELRFVCSEEVEQVVVRGSSIGCVRGDMLSIANLDHGLPMVLEGSRLCARRGWWNIDDLPQVNVSARAGRRTGPGRDCGFGGLMRNLLSNRVVLQERWPQPGDLAD
jgi:hypothetical protein